MPFLADAPLAFYALDVASALAAAYVAAVFLRTWRVVGRPFVLAAAVGFALIGTSFLFVTASQTGDLPAGFAAAGRYWGMMTGLLVLLLSYMAARWGGERFLTFVAAGLALAQVIVLAVAFVVPPFQGFPTEGDAELYVTAVNLVLAGATAAMGSHSFVRQPDRGHLAVPGGLLFLALSLYTWMFHAGQGSDLTLMLAYVWQLGALGLFILATVQRGDEGGDDGAP